jgi:hypothetical protein
VQAAVAAPLPRSRRPRQPLVLALELKVSRFLAAIPKMRPGL